MASLYWTDNEAGESSGPNDSISTTLTDELDRVLDTSDESDSIVAIYHFGSQTSAANGLFPNLDDLSLGSSSSDESSDKPEDERISETRSGPSGSGGPSRSSARKPIWPDSDPEHGEEDLIKLPRTANGLVDLDAVKNERCTTNNPCLLDRMIFQEYMDNSFIIQTQQIILEHLTQAIPDDNKHES